LTRIFKAGATYHI